MRKAIRRVVNKFGFDVRRIARDARADASPSARRAALLNAGTMTAGCERAKERGLSPATVIDVGAAAGWWTRRTLDVWPDADYVLIEPLAERRAELEAMKQGRRPGQIETVYAVVGKAAGEVTFTVSDDLDGSGVYDKGEGLNVRTVPMVSLDDAVARLGKKPPYLVKLDTHGFELPILDGAAGILGQAQLLVVEAYNFRVSSTAPLFWELCRYLDEKGFRCVDAVDLMRREFDAALWQFDLFFEPKASPVFGVERYRR